MFDWKKTDYSLFEKADMYLWHGIKSSVEKKLACNIDEIKAKGHKFTYKVFTDVGHGGLVGEHTSWFAEEVKTAHASSLEKLATSSLYYNSNERKGKAERLDRVMLFTGASDFICRL